jgi:hypothetical protein
MSASHATTQTNKQTVADKNTILASSCTRNNFIAPRLTLQNPVKNRLQIGSLFFHWKKKNAVGLMVKQHHKG